MSDSPLPSAPGPLKVSLSTEGRDGDRWRCRVWILPCEIPIELAGATLSFVDEGGAPAGPVVVLPVEGSLSEPLALHVSVRAPERLPPGALLRLTVFLGGTCEALVWDESVTQQEGFQDFLAGRTLMPMSPAPEGHNLSSVEITALAAAFPWLVEKTIPPDAAKAFDVFQEDLLASADLDDDESVTAEILRMLRDT